MDTRMLSVTATLGAPPDEVFDIVTNSEKHSELTNAESIIENRVGGRFSYFGGGVSGVFKELEPKRRIVQELRAADWPDGHYANVSYQLLPTGNGHQTHVEVLETGVPTARLDDVIRGWQAYWEAFAGYLREQRVKVVRRFVGEYKNNQNPDIVDQLVANDCAVHIPLPGLPQGREGMRTNGRLVCSAFPDVHVTGEFLLTEGDIVIERANAEATHRGELLGTPPTGKKVTWTELHAYRVTGNLITEVWSEADFMGMLAQIGAIKPPAD